MKELLYVFTLFPALFCGFKTAAQHSSSRFSIVLSPALFVPVTAAIQGGIEYRTSNRTSVLVEAAVPVFNPKNEQYEKIDFLRTGMEFKYFLRSDSSISKYVSIQSNYLCREFTDKDQAFYYTKKETFSYTNAVIKSPVLSTALKIGTELRAGKKLFFDAFVGAGLRFIFTDYNTKNALITSTPPPKQSLFNFDDAWSFNYTLTRLHATGGLRIGWRL